MKNSLSNSELIDQIYNEAGEKLVAYIDDWSDYKKWTDGVSKLYKEERTIYLIGILNLQVMNGGFMQYFDNNYGIFAYETLEVLKEIGANKTYELLSKALSIINKDSLQGSNFREFVWSLFVNDKEADLLDKLDDEYYNLDEIESLENLIADFLIRK